VSEFTALMLRAGNGDIAAQQNICERYERQVRIVLRVILGPQLRPYLDTVDLLLISASQLAGRTQGSQLRHFVARKTSGFGLHHGPTQSGAKLANA